MEGILYRVILTYSGRSFVPATLILGITADVHYPGLSV
jgi:hypothetical protein